MFLLSTEITIKSCIACIGNHTNLLFMSEAVIRGIPEQGVSKNTGLKSANI